VTISVTEIGPGETGLAFEAMRALRTHRDDLEAFVRRVDEVQRPQGYRVVGSRRRGHAARLLAWCAEEARRMGCDVLELDSAVGPEREDAHRLYFNQGLRISAFHFEGPV
jgi:GNAT superfamily N-acetyltransferase